MHVAIDSVIIYSHQELHGPIVACVYAAPQFVSISSLPVYSYRSADLQQSPEIHRVYGAS